MTDVDKRLTKRPKFLTLVCLIALVYSGLLTLVFLSGIFLSLGAGDIIITYADLYELPRSRIIVASIAGFLLFGVSFWGILKIYHLQRMGFYIFLITGLLLVLLQLTQGFVNWYFFTVYIVFSIIFLLFFKRLSPKKKHTTETNQTQ